MNHDSSSIITESLVTAYEPSLVVLSILIAMVASFSAFGIVERNFSSTKRSQKIAWNLFGGSVMGIGIWAMHFIGMLALRLPIPVTYDAQVTILSVLPAVCACSAVLWLMTLKSLGFYRLLVGGLLLGSGIGLMHYTGMAAMRLNAMMIHEAALVYLSLLIAVILAVVALKIKYKVIR
jgi:NO-binding membrane sensor protein with MHYT domain